MTIIRRNNLQEIEALCERASKETKRVEQAKLFGLDWENRPETLLHKFHNGVFDQSGYFTVTKDGQVVAGAGYYQYEDFTLLMSRFFVVPEFRTTWIGESILQMQVGMMKTDRGMITCNDVNKGLYDKLCSISGQPNSDSWPGMWRKFRPLGLMKINYVDQWCMEISKADI